MAAEVLRMRPGSSTITGAHYKDVSTLKATDISRKQSVDSISQFPASSDYLPQPSTFKLQSQDDIVPADENSPTIETAPEGLEDLIGQLDRAKLESIATAQPHRIEIPEGFQLGMGFNVTEYYGLRTQFRRLDKRKRDLGVLTKSSRRQKHGFRPEELLWYGALELKNCRSSTLQNDIHPLFHQDCFDDTPDHVYDQLRPGLALATMFLTHPACMQFWVTLAKGDRREDPEMTRRCGHLRHRITRNVDLTEENTREVIKYIEDLGKAKAIHFTFAPGLVFEGKAAFGTACTVCDFALESSENRSTTTNSGCLQRSHIRLHGDFYVIAKKLSRMKYPDPAQHLRFNFILALLLVHEMAHAIELSQWCNRAPSPFEPFMLHHNEAELGRMWEAYMFGGQVCPINDRIDGIYGLSTWKWPRSFGEMDPERTICYSLPMTYIERLQQREFWEGLDTDDFSNRKTFWIPRDGATSVYMNNVTTVSWTEEERVAKEMMEEKQTREAEEPARKKREVRDGQAVPITDLGVEPEMKESSKVQEKKGSTAQGVQRVKREPKSILSRKQRRAQKKVGQSSSPRKHVSASSESNTAKSDPGESEKGLEMDLEEEEEDAMTTTTKEPSKSKPAAKDNPSTAKSESAPEHRQDKSETQEPSPSTPENTVSNEMKRTSSEKEKRKV